MIIIVRKRYNAAYHTKNPDSREEGHVLIPEEISEISAHIDTIESKMQEILNMTCKDKNDVQRQRYKVSSMLKLFSDIDNIDLPIDLLQRVYSIFPTDQLHKVMDIHAKDGIERKQGHYIIKYANAIGKQIEKTDDLEKLEKLFKTFSSIFGKSNYAVSTIRSKILKKIQTIKLSKVEGVLRQSEDKASAVVSMLMDPEVDIDTINQKVAEAADEYYENRMKVVNETDVNQRTAAVQAPTKEGSIRQIRFYILNEIRNGSSFVDNADFMLQRMQGISIDKNVAIHSLMESFIKDKKYDEAMKFAEGAYGRSCNVVDRNSFKTYKKRIQYLEVADLIMKGINARERSIEDENKYYEMIQRGIEQAKLDPRLIILGKTEDGHKSITYADIAEIVKPSIERE